MKKKLTITLLFLTTIVFGQVDIDTNKVKQLNKYQFAGIYKSTISINLGGTSGFIGGSYDVFLSEHWRFEIGAGFPALGIGFGYYPYKIKRSSERFMITFKSVYFNSPWRLPVYQHSIGIGLTHFTRNKWNWTFDVGPMYVHTTDSFYYLEPEDSPVSLMMNIKAGYRFSFKANKRRKELEKEER